MSDVDEDFSDALTRIPESVKDLLLRRLRRLDETCKRLVTFAAVSGREFALDVLEQVAEMPADRIAETLEEAIAARIVEESPSSIGTYSFAHALIRESIYEQISLTRRAQMHHRIGEAIESVSDAGATMLRARSHTTSRPLGTWLRPTSTTRAPPPAHNA